MFSFHCLPLLLASSQFLSSGDSERKLEEVVIPQRQKKRGVIDLEKVPKFLIFQFWQDRVWNLDCLWDPRSPSRGILEKGSQVWKLLFWNSILTLPQDPAACANSWLPCWPGSHGGQALPPFWWRLARRCDRRKIKGWEKQEKLHRKVRRIPLQKQEQNFPEHMATF